MKELLERLVEMAESFNDVEMLEAHAGKWTVSVRNSTYSKERTIEVSRPLDDEAEEAQDEER